MRLSDLSVDNRVEWYKNCWRRASYHCRLSNGRDGNARGEGTRPVASHLAVASIKEGVQRQGMLACLCTPYGGAIVPRVDSCDAASRFLRCLLRYLRVVFFVDLWVVLCFDDVVVLVAVLFVAVVVVVAGL